jgi:hypothetical protein
MEFPLAPLRNHPVLELVPPLDRKAAEQLPGTAPIQEGRKRREIAFPATVQIIMGEEPPMHEWFLSSDAKMFPSMLELIHNPQP